MRAENKSRKRGGFGLCLGLKGGITDIDGHPEIGVFPKLQNFHGNKYHN